MVVKCDIQFEKNSDGCYFAGQVLTGKIVLTADKIKQVKAVVLKVKGFAHTFWWEKDSSDSSTIYNGHIDYLDTLTYLLSPTTPDESVVIKPGEHSFNFACEIPINCPSSIESSRGHVRYVVTVCLVRPWMFDQTFTKGFTVLKVMDLNNDAAALLTPVNSQMSKSFFCGPLKTDPLQMHVQLPQSGYVPGQFIPVNILVTNDTNANINEICVRLVMVATLSSQRPRVHSVDDCKTVSKLIGDAVPMFCKKQFNYMLPVPATPPTCLSLCSLVQITYRIEVEAKMRGIFYANQEIHTPVTIGNVPIVDDTKEKSMVKEEGPLKPDEEHHKKTTPVDVDKETVPSNSQPWSSNDTIPCPVFMEASFMPHAKLADAAQHDFGEEKFTPKYPVYTMESPSIEVKEETAVPPTTPD